MHFPFYLYTTLFGIAFAIYHFAVVSTVDKIDIYSLISESGVAAILLLLLYQVSQLNIEKKVFNSLNLGFSLLFIALLTDSFDEYFVHSTLTTTIFEDGFELAGFILVLYGTHHWIINQRKHVEELKKLSITDELTGLHSRRHFNEQIQNELALFRRTHRPFSVMMIDVDNFKQINDQYGHAAGDLVLKSFADTLRQHLRDYDTIARWGGEEFIVLMRDTNVGNSQLFSETVRFNTEKLELIYEDQHIPFTVSVGIAVSKSTDISSDSIIKRADNRLYKAKESGKNQVVIPS